VSRTGPGAHDATEHITVSLGNQMRGVTTGLWLSKPSH